jgi:hypothetical protein
MTLLAAERVVKLVDAEACGGARMICRIKARNTTTLLIL